MIMKIFEALKLKKDLQERIQNLGNRYEENVRVKEGEKPLEDPNDVMKELEECLSQLYDLCCRINYANMNPENCNSKGKIIMELLCEREIQKSRQEILNKSFGAVSSRYHYYYGEKDENKYKNIVDIKTLDKKVKEGEAKLRELELEIEALDVKTEI